MGMLNNCPNCGHKYTELEQMVGKCEKCLHSVIFLGSTIKVVPPEPSTTGITAVKTVQ